MKELTSHYTIDNITILPEKTYGNVLEIFAHDEYMKMGLKLVEGTVLKWFIRFALSNEMKSETFDNQSFYWVLYKKVAWELGLSEKQVKETFYKLCGKRGKDEKHFPALLFQYVKPSKTGKKTYFAFNRDKLMLILADNFKLNYKDAINSIASDVTVNIAQITAEQKALKTGRIITPRVLEIIKTMLDVKDSSGNYIFNSRLPEEGKPYSKLMISASDKLHSLFEGRFLSKYPLDTESNDYFAEIREVKGDWEKVEALILKALKNYRKNEHFTPTMKNINFFLFNEGTQTSGFLLSLVKVPVNNRIKETIADRIYEHDSISAEMAVLAKTVLKPEFDPVVFWTKIKSVGVWYDERKKKLCALDNNCGYWFDGGKDVWFKNYINWLVELAGGKDRLYISNFGTGNKTWAAWCKTGMKNHSIEIDVDMPLESLTKKYKKKMGD